MMEAYFEKYYIYSHLLSLKGKQAGKFNGMVV